MIKGCPSKAKMFPVLVHSRLQLSGGDLVWLDDMNENSPTLKWSVWIVDKPHENISYPEIKLWFVLINNKAWICLVIFPVLSYRLLVFT